MSPKGKLQTVYPHLASLVLTIIYLLATLFVISLLATYQVVDRSGVGMLIAIALVIWLVAVVAIIARISDSSRPFLDRIRPRRIRRDLQYHHSPLSQNQGTFHGRGAAGPPRDYDPIRSKTRSLIKQPIRRV